MDFMERWKVNLFTLWVSQIISLMSFGFGLPYIPLYIQQLGVTEPDKVKMFAAVLAFAPAITMAIMAPVWGRLADRYGRKLMILRAMFAAVFVIGAMGLVSNVWQLVGLRAAQGLFTGTITAATTFVAANTPRDKLSYALGVMSSSTFIGYAIGPLIGGFFAEAFGYRFSFFIGAILMLVGFLIVLIKLKEDKSLIGAESGKKVHGKPHLYRRTGFNVFTPLIVSLLVVLFLQRLTRSVFAPYLSLFVQESLGSTEGAAMMTGIVSGITGFATAAAGLTISRLGDKRNKLNLVRVLMGVSLVISLTLTWTNSLWVFMGLYGLLFFFLGGIEPIITSTTAENTPAERRGVLFGYQGLVGSLGWLVSPMLGGYISVQFSTKGILFLIPICIIANLTVVSVLKNRERRELPESGTA